MSTLPTTLKTVIRITDISLVFNIFNKVGTSAIKKSTYVDVLIEQSKMLHLPNKYNLS